jgi:protein-tyrosine phosphatase
VRTANRGRSPIAEAMLRRKLRERGFAHVSVESAGRCVHELGQTGMGVSTLAADIAARHGIDLSRHRARVFEAHRFSEFDLIVVKEGWQEEALERVFHPQDGKVVTLRQLGGESDDPNTPDVAGVPADALEAYFVEAERCLDAALENGPLAWLFARAPSSAASRASIKEPA